MNDELSKNLHRLVRFSSKDRLGRIIPLNWYVGEQLRHIEDEYPACASILVMAGNSFRLQMSFFYHATDLFELASKSVGVPTFEYSRELLEDFLEEYCNLVAGSISAELHDASIRARIGLPLSSRGFGEPGVRHSTSVDYFEMSSGEIHILGKSTVYQFPDTPAPTYVFSELKSSEQEVEDFFDFI